MKKPVIIIILICLTTTVVGAGIYIYIKNQARLETINNQVVSPQIKTLNCETVINDSEKANCQLNVFKVLNSESSSACDNLMVESDKKNCQYTYVIKEAAVSGDLSNCEAMSDKILAANCSAQAYFSLAIRKKDKKYCQSIADQATKDNCFKVLTDIEVK